MPSGVLNFPCHITNTIHIAETRTNSSCTFPQVVNMNILVYSQLTRNHLISRFYFTHVYWQKNQQYCDDENAKFIRFPWPAFTKASKQLTHWRGVHSVCLTRVIEDLCFKMRLPTVSRLTRRLEQAKLSNGDISFFSKFDTICLSFFRSVFPIQNGNLSLSLSVHKPRSVSFLHL